MIIEILLIIIGFAFLIKGADVLVSGSEKIAKKFHIPEIIIGLTIVSIGTSMPEMFVSITSAISGHADMSIGNVIGSNICNLLLILGLSTVIKSIKFKKETRLIEIPLTLIFTIIFLILCNINQDISKIDSIILILLFIGFLIYTVIMAKKGEEFDSNDTYVEESKNVKEVKRTKTTWGAIISIVLGIVALKFGGDLVVINAEKIALILNISEKIISLTIIAIGTSLPELVTSVVAAIKGDSDIAIGNVLGSNIFNILLILGVSGLIQPMTYSIEYNSQIIVLIVSTILLALYPFIGRKNEMTRFNGVTYLIIYIIYMLVLFTNKTF